MSALQRELLKEQLPPIPLSSRSTPKPLEKSSLQVEPWQTYFERAHDLAVFGGYERTTIRVYSSGEATKSPLTFVLLHGAGMTSLSWACCAKTLATTDRVVAIDFRGHGQSTSPDNHDMSIGTLVSDIQKVLKMLETPEYGEHKQIIMVGHSAGGAVACRVAEANAERKTIVGLVVMDVVEGTALAALPEMHSIIEKRPTTFSTLQDAIYWSVQSGMIKNVESAQVSIPDQLIQDKETNQYKWQVDLAGTEKHWEQWFRGLSKCFLGVGVPKILALAGTDRLDTPLTVAQMQGKFQMLILPACGHCIQEDQPQLVARKLLAFKRRYKFG